MIKIQLKGHDIEYLIIVQKSLTHGNSAIKNECNSRQSATPRPVVATIGYSPSCETCVYKNACRDLTRAEKYITKKLMEIVRGR